MEKRNKIILTSIIILTIVVISICIYCIIHNRKIYEDDALKFRSEYMELNDKVNTSVDKIYPNVVVSKTNTVKYIDATKAVDILEKGSGIIYIGFPSCPWCRTLVPTLIRLAEEVNEPIYYIDISSIKSVFEVSNGVLKKTKDGSVEYYKMLDKLDEYLEAYYVKDSKGNNYDTKEKRIYSPTLIAVSNGVIKDFHEGTVDSQASGYDTLSSSEEKELEDIIRNLINSKRREACSEDEAC